MKNVVLTILASAVFLLFWTLATAGDRALANQAAAGITTAPEGAQSSLAATDPSLPVLSGQDSLTSAEANVPVSASSPVALADDDAVPAAGDVVPTVVDAYEAELAAFTASVINGQAGQVVGVFVPDVMALPVVQQPNGDAGYVSELDQTLTQFGMPAAYGTIGLLAHNYLSGVHFPRLQENQDVIVVYGDGDQDRYRVTRIQRFQALSPHSVYSDFIDLDDPARTVITAGELFNRIYTQPGQVVFQTCIDAYGNPSWGRLFITAEQIEY